MLDIGHFLDMELSMFIYFITVYCIILYYNCYVISKKSLLLFTRKRHTQTNKAINLFLLALINERQLS